MNVTDSATTRAGRLEVCINNAWGTVCDDRFDSIDATVACTQLKGFNSSGQYTLSNNRAYGLSLILNVDAEFLPRGSHEQGSGSIFLSNLLCNGDESSLLNCVTTRNQPPGTFSCQHSQDVAIECTGIYIQQAIPLPTLSPSSQTLMSVLRTMEGATRPVPTLSGATSVVARVAIYSTRMGEAAIVSTYHTEYQDCKIFFYIRCE